MGRALQPPAVRGALPLEELQHAQLVAVHGLHVAVEEPVSVRRDPRGGEEHLRLELERHQVVVLDRAARRLRQHRPQPRRHRVLRGDDRLRRGEASRVVLGGDARRRARRRLLPSAQRADPGVLAEERGERGRARAREADSEQLDFHFLVLDLRVTGVPVLDLQSVGQGADERVVEHVLTELVEVRLGERRAQQHLEPLAPRVGAEVVQAGVCARARSTSSCSRAATVTLAALTGVRPGRAASSAPSSRWRTRRPSV